MKEYFSVSSMSGKSSNVAVTFINATFQKENETTNRFPDPEFGPWLIEQIYNEKQVMAKRKGLFNKKLVCSSCDTELNPETETRTQIDLELKYKEFSPFALQITLPSIVCPKCKKVCGMDLDGSLNYHLNEAMIDAFESKNIKP